MSDKIQNLRNRLESEILLLDGAFGTMLQLSGLKLGEYPERLNLTDPERIFKIHRAYAESGAQAVYTNTFGANRKKLPKDLNLEEVVTAAVKIARRAADSALVALDVGPIGELLEPMGSLRFEEAVEIFAEIMRCGEEAGADFIAVETMTDLGEVRAAILAAKENTSLPVFATMSFEESGRTFTGCDARAFAMTASGLGADAVGVNCSLGPVQLLPIVKTIAEYTDLPLIVKANAGLPLPDGSGYSVSAEEFCEAYEAFLELGVSVVGGCCGTTPEYIAKLKDMIQNRSRTSRPRANRRAVCSATKIVELNGVRVVGERINPTGKPLMKAALAEGNTDYVLNQAISQIEAGAEILDVNVGVPGTDERVSVLKVVKAVQSACDAPLQIDSTKPDVVEAGLRNFHGKAIVNSVNGEDAILDSLLPIVKKYGAAVVGLTLDERGIPKSADERVAIAEKILSRAKAYGIAAEDVVIDCLTLTVSAEQSQVAETLEAIRRVKKMGLLTTLGVSNVSFGLPRRELVNSAFLCLALGAGLDLPITNPNISANMDAIRSFRALSGQDKNCTDFVEAYAGTAAAQGSPSANATAGANSKESDSAEHTVAYCVKKGLPEISALVRKLLETRPPLTIVNEFLIPALDEVGKLFEANKIFLPQLILAAETAKLGFEEIKRAIPGSESSKGTIVLATVKGDVHDIGKNIVKVVLENYGYRIVDLGKNVPPEEVVEAVKRENVRLVGLSALMTTTVVSMKETIDALKSAGCKCKVMVGGAVLTEEYAKTIGADFYAKDANRSVKFAKEILG